MSTDHSSEIEAAEVERRVLAFIHTELLDPGETVERDDDLLSDLIDSVAALRLARFVAEDFEIELQPADFVIENFRTVQAIGRFVRQARRR